jgi:hypothetical protein
VTKAFLPLLGAWEDCEHQLRRWQDCRTLHGRLLGIEVRAGRFL